MQKKKKQKQKQIHIQKKLYVVCVTEKHEYMAKNIVIGVTVLICDHKTYKN